MLCHREPRLSKRSNFKGKRGKRRQVGEKCGADEVQRRFDSLEFVLQVNQSWLRSIWWWERSLRLLKRYNAASFFPCRYASPDVLPLAREARQQCTQRRIFFLKYFFFNRHHPSTCCALSLPRFIAKTFLLVAPEIIMHVGGSFRPTLCCCGVGMETAWCSHGNVEMRAFRTKSCAKL